MTITSFEVGKVYACRSFGNHDIVWAFRVDARTPQTVTLTEVTHGTDGDTKRRKVRIYSDVEHVDPLGRFSLSPVLTANDQVEVST